MLVRFRICNADISCMGIARWSKELVEVLCGRRFTMQSFRSEIVRSEWCERESGSDSNVRYSFVREEIVRLTDGAREDNCAGRVVNLGSMGGTPSTDRVRGVGPEVVTVLRLNANLDFGVDAVRSSSRFFSKPLSCCE